MGTLCLFSSIFFFLSTYNSSKKIKSILSGEKICVRWFCKFYVGFFVPLCVISPSRRITDNQGKVCFCVSPDNIAELIQYDESLVKRLVCTCGGWVTTENKAHEREKNSIINSINECVI